MQSRFNRIFMELKYYALYYSKSAGDSFNRTFMELKLQDARGKKIKNEF